MILVYLFLVLSSRLLCPQLKVFADILKALWDNHPSCANCFNCSVQFTCEFCCSWSQSTSSKFEQRHSSKAKMGRKSTKEKEQFAFSARPVKPKKKSAPAEIFGFMTFLIMEDQQTNKQTIWATYHLRMILYRVTLTNRTGLGLKEGEVSRVRLPQDPVFLTGKFDPIFHWTDSPVRNHWVNLPVVNSWTSVPVNYVLPDWTDQGQQSPDRPTGQLSTR